MAIAVGDRVGAYEVLGLLGSGGMGVVYRARDVRLKRDVALKVLPKERASDPERLRRFEVEARAVAALTHPNVVSVFDVGTHEGAPFLVMELLDGVTLRGRLAQGPLGARKAVEYAVQMASGLAAAHERRILHRDLKPENVFVCRDGRVKLLDFGLAKPASPEDAGGTVDQSQSGAVVGTAGYMSPEQVQGKAADERSDVFAFGAVLYELLSGKRAFDGATPIERGYAILNREPPALGTGAPLAVERIVRRCLEKQPELRFQGAKDLGFALEAVRETSSDSQAPLTEGGLGVGRRAVVVGLVAATVAFGVGWYARPVTERTPAAGSAQRAEGATLPSFRRVSFREGLLGRARFGPGNTLFFDAVYSGKPEQVFEGSIGRTDTRAVSAPGYSLAGVSRAGDLLLQRKSPSSDAVAALSTVAIAAPSGAPRELATDVLSASMSADGRVVAIVRAGVERSRLEWPIGNVVLELDDEVGGLTLSADGTLAAWFAKSGAAINVELVTPQGVRRTLSGPWANADGLAWGPDGKEIWFTAGTSPLRSLWAVSLTGALRQLYAAPGRLSLGDVSPDGRVLLKRTEARRRIVERSSDTETDVSLFDGTNVSDISSDGRVLLLVEWAEAAEGTDAQREGLLDGGPRSRSYIRSLDDDSVVHISDYPLYCLSPDAGWAAGPSGSSYVLVPVGPGTARHIDLGELRPSGCVWARDDSQLVVWVSHAPRRQQVWRVPLDGGAPSALDGHGFLTTSNATSEDGRWLTVSFLDGGSSLVSLQGERTSLLRQLPPGLVPFDWSANGRELFVKRMGRQTKTEVFRFDIESGRLTPFARIGPADTAGVDPASPPWIFVTPDGKRTVYSYLRRTNDLYLAEGLR